MLKSSNLDKQFLIYLVLFEAFAILLYYSQSNYAVSIARDMQLEYGDATDFSFPLLIKAFAPLVYLLYTLILLQTIFRSKLGVGVLKELKEKGIPILTLEIGKMVMLSLLFIDHILYWWRYTPPN